MTLVKHNPKALNYLFDEFFGAFPGAWGKDFQNGFVNPPVNIHENAEGYHLELSVPGLNKEDFKLNVEDGLLTISFEKNQETENKEYKTIRREFVARSFKRSFSLDEKVNAEEIKAKYENGVLKIFLPKKEEVKATPKQISIQ